MISGDDIRKIFKLKGYEYKDRLIITNKYSTVTSTMAAAVVGIIPFSQLTVLLLL